MSDGAYGTAIPRLTSRLTHGSFASSLYSRASLRADAMILVGAQEDESVMWRGKERVSGVCMVGGEAADDQNY